MKNIKTKRQSMYIVQQLIFFFKGLFRYQKRNLLSSKSDIILFNIYTQINLAIKFEFVPNFLLI